MSKLKEDLRVGILGAAAGLFSISVALLIARIDYHYKYLAWLEETGYEPYCNVEGLWWMPFAFWHILLSVVAALVAHRYLRTGLSSPFLLWQVIGLASLVGWGLTVFLVVGMECVGRGNLNSLQQLMDIVDVPNVVKYVSAVFACNVFYGSVMKASSRQYTEQFDFAEHE